MARKNCIKCGKGVRVLVCKSSKCPVAIHESCMPSSLQVHDRKNFYCPHCLYKQSVAECYQAKDKALLAQRKLSIFLGINTSENKEHEQSIARDKHLTLQNHKELDNQEMVGEPRQGCKSLWAENDPKGGEHSRDHVREMPSDDGAAFSALVKKNGYLRNCKGSVKVASCSNGIKLLEYQKNYDGENCDSLCSKVEGGVLTVDSVSACKKRTANVDYHFKTPMSLDVAGGDRIQYNQPIYSYGYKNVNFTQDQQYLKPFSSCNMEKGMQLELPLHNLRERNHESGKLAETDLLKLEDKWHGEAGPCETATCSLIGTYTSCNYRTEMYARLARRRIQKVIESKSFNHPGKVSNKLSRNEVDRSSEPNIVASSNARWIEKPGIKILNGVVSDGRRKRLRWTTEEEEMLKKGVLMFSTAVKKNLPWRKVLEFGHHVFDRSRTPSDLKSKWKIIAEREHVKS